MRASKAKLLRKIAKKQLEEKQKDTKRDLMTTVYVPGRTRRMNFCFRSLTKNLKTVYKDLKSKGKHRLYK